MEYTHWSYASLFLISCYVFRSFMQSTSNPPPSPPRVPILGHALKFPQTQAWKTFAEWGKEYGSIVFTKVMGRSMIIINSISVARDLMEKKSANYSDRPKMPLLDMVGWDVILPTLPYGSTLFRKQRRLMQQWFGPSAVRTYENIMEEYTSKFLSRLLTSPDSFHREVHGHIASVILRTVYGHDVSGNPADDPVIILNERATKMTIETGTIGATFIDIFPLLRHVPSWFPGMNLKRRAFQIRDLMQIVLSLPYEKVKLERADGTAHRSIVYQLLEEHDGSSEISPEGETALMSFAGTVYNAGTDTTRTALQMFFLVMVFNQEVQRRAQEEIDRVIGLDRLPTFNDRASLPYVECIVKEVLRINPPVPLGVPHCSTQADEYNGWEIPARSMIVPNIWYMMRNEQLFPDPESFNPDRHGNNGDDLVSPVFGFGRRYCPGRAFAESMMWITIANVLAAFDIFPWKNPTTNEEVPPVVEFESEIVNAVKPFNCRIVPRSGRLAQISREG